MTFSRWLIKLDPGQDQKYSYCDIVVTFHLSCNKSHSVGINFVINGLKLFNYLLEVDKKNESFKKTCLKWVKWEKGGLREKGQA